MAWIQLPLTRQRFIYSPYRGLKPTAKVMRPLRGQDIADLTEMADAFETTFSTTAAATAEHVEAPQTGESIRLGMVAVRIVDGVVKNKYANDVGKLAAWTRASHVEKAPKNKEPTP